MEATETYTYKRELGFYLRDLAMSASSAPSEARLNQLRHSRTQVLEVVGGPSLAEQEIKEFQDGLRLTSSKGCSREQLVQQLQCLTDLQRGSDPRPDITQNQQQVLGVELETYAGSFCQALLLPQGKKETIPQTQQALMEQGLPVGLIDEVERSVLDHLLENPTREETRLPLSSIVDKYQEIGVLDQFISRSYRPEIFLPNPELERPRVCVTSVFAWRISAPTLKTSWDLIVPDQYDAWMPPGMEEYNPEERLRCFLESCRGQWFHYKMKTWRRLLEECSGREQAVHKLMRNKHVTNPGVPLEVKQTAGFVGGSRLEPDNDLRDMFTWDKVSQMVYKRFMEVVPDSNRETGEPGKPKETQIMRVPLNFSGFELVKLWHEKEEEKHRRGLRVVADIEAREAGRRTAKRLQQLPQVSQN